MSTTPAGWYDDPERPERLRYWDGAAWTAWVSEGGVTSNDPVGAGAAAVALAAGDAGPDAPPAGPAEGARPAALPGPVPVRPYPMRPVARAGHGLVAAAGVLAMFTAGRTITVQVSDRLETTVYESTASLVFLAATMLAAGVVGALVSNVWVRMTALLTGAGAAGFLALALVGTSTEDDLAYLDVRPAWWMLFAAAGLGLAGTLAAALAATPRGEGPDGMRPAAPWAGMGLGAALVGIVIMPLSAVGAAFGVLGLRDAASATPPRRRRLALAAAVAGTAVFAAWSLGLLGAALAGTRSAPLDRPPDTSGGAAILFRVA
jgi:hypothetical protein